MRARLLAVALLALAACTREDPAALRAERDALLASTVPRDEYWKEVGRKGTALRDARAAGAREERTRAEDAALETQRAGLQAQLQEAHRANDELAGLIATAARLRAEREHNQQQLEAFLAEAAPP